MTATTLDLIRHGLPEGGTRFRGQRDDPLSEQGWREMWQAVDRSPAPWELICCSPLRRCRDFALALGERLALEVKEDARLKEVGFGVWEGLTPEEARRRDPELFRDFYWDPIHRRPEGAEPLESFRDRVVQVFDDILAGYQGQHLLIVTHAGVIRTLVAHVLEAPLITLYRLTLETAGVSRLRIDGERPPSILFHGRRRL